MPAFQLSHGGDPITIALELRRRIQTRWRIDQGGASLCGPAAFIYCLAKDAPELYARYISDLYISGRAQINGLTVEPSEACKTGNIRIENSEGQITRQIPAIDWIALASLRDSSHGFLRQHSVSSDSGGITMPEAVAEWFTAAGYQHVSKNTRVLGSAPPEAFLEAAQLYQHNRNVCLFIASKVKTASLAIQTIPNHWVVMSNQLQWKNSGQPSNNQNPSNGDHDGRVPSVKVYHWGIDADELNQNNLPLNDFSQYYFGYVVAS